MATIDYKKDPATLRSCRAFDFLSDFSNYSDYRLWNKKKLSLALKMEKPRDFVVRFLFRFKYALKIVCNGSKIDFYIKVVKLLYKNKSATQRVTEQINTISDFYIA